MITPYFASHAVPSKLQALLDSKYAEAFRYGPDKPLVVLRAHWPIDRALKVLLKHGITAAVSRLAPRVPALAALVVG